MSKQKKAKDRRDGGKKSRLVWKGMEKRGNRLVAGEGHPEEKKSGTVREKTTKKSREAGLNMGQVKDEMESYRGRQKLKRQKCRPTELGGRTSRGSKSKKTSEGWKNI